MSTRQNADANVTVKLLIVSVWSRMDSEESSNDYAEDRGAFLKAERSEEEQNTNDLCGAQQLSERTLEEELLQE